MKFLDRVALLIERRKETEIERLSRRVWMKNLAVVSATGAVMWACGKDDAKSEDKPTTATLDYKGDGEKLNAALALEHEAISIYTQAAKLPAMTATSAAAVLAIAGSFLDHHKAHRDALVAAIGELKKKDATVADPVATKGDADYVSAELAAKLTDVKAILRVAAIKEGGAAEAYLGLISSFSDKNLAQTSGMLGGEEAGHFGVLRAALLVVASDATVTPAKVIPSVYPSGWESAKLPAPGA